MKLLTFKFFIISFLVLTISISYSADKQEIGNVIIYENNIEKLLENSASKFINHKRGVENIEGELKVSSIYVWFKSDFGNNVIEHQKKYANGSLKKELENNKNGISSHSYDWRINAP